MAPPFWLPADVGTLPFELGQFVHKILHPDETVFVTEHVVRGCDVVEALPGLLPVGAF